MTDIFAPQEETILEQQPEMMTLDQTLSLLIQNVDRMGDALEQHAEAMNVINRNLSIVRSQIGYLLSQDSAYMESLERLAKEEQEKTNDHPV